MTVRAALAWRVSASPLPAASDGAERLEDH